MQHFTGIKVCKEIKDVIDYIKDPSIHNRGITSPRNMNKLCSNGIKGKRPSSRRSFPVVFYQGRTRWRKKRRNRVMTTPAVAAASP